MNQSISKNMVHVFMALTVLAGSLAFPGDVHADGVIIVTTTADDTTADGQCSLREAIINANDDATTHTNCTGGSGDDIILFADTLGTNTILLSGNLPAITQAADLTIDGGTDISIDGNNAAVPFSITGSSSVVTLDNLTITKGNALSGGAVYNAGDLTIDGSTLSANTATASCTSCGGGAVLNEGSLTVTNSTFTSNSASAGGGGGIYNTGTLNVTNSTFSSNSSIGANGGGGIYNSGTLSITNSIFSSNSGTNGGGGIASAGPLTVNKSTFSSNSASAGYGGGITITSSATITNSTFSSNSAPAAWGGGVHKSSPNTVTITNSTFSGNSAMTGGGGGVSVMQGTLNLYNTIIANSAGSYDCVKVPTGVTAGSNNLIEGSGTNACDFTDGDSGNVIGFDPDLGTLTGSPAYFPIQYDSLAFNAGDDTICAAAPVSNASQNNVTRPASAHCDIGSFEVPMYTISGNAGVEGAMLGYYNGSPQSVTADGNGDYSLEVPHDWSGMVIPYKPEYAFTPEYLEYTNVAASLTGEDYTATSATDVDVSLAGAPVETYSIAQRTTTRVNFAATNTGPVQLLSDSLIPIVPSERVIYSVNGTATSFSEMMGLPLCSCMDTYFFPWYNNVDLDTQIRFGNLDGVSTEVTIKVGDTEYGPYPLDPGESTRISLPGVNDGPVTVYSTGETIIAAERVIYTVNGTATSFSELMGLPGMDVSHTYHFPWYNNVDLDTQFRFANLDSVSTEVTIKVGDTEYGPYLLDSGESTRISLPGVNDGPVTVYSTGEAIIAAERVIYTVNGTATSFSELMGIPDFNVDSTYHFPWYNNVDLDTQFRFANLDSVDTDVTITVGSTDYGPYSLDAGESTRISLPGVNDGPVTVHSTGEWIIAAERVIYTVNSTATSFSEMMGLPGYLLDVEYWFPWYNNVDLDTQLRIGNP
jgi:CSLREA domain-containing protein